jgi:hypothetical protein
MPTKDYYKRHKLEMKEYQRSRRQRYWEYAANIKVPKGCKNCGFDANSNKLHLHHRNPSTKLFSIALGHMYKWPVYLAEIRKCDVLCLPCHAKVHSSMRRKGGKLRT